MQARTYNTTWPFGSNGVATANLSHRGRQGLAAFLAGILSCLALQWSSAQTAPATQPDLKLSKGGLVRAMVFQPDGKLIIAGRFTSVNGVARSNIARINLNGSVDATWHPSIDKFRDPFSYDDPASVEALAIHENYVYAAGDFDLADGAARDGLARFELTGTGVVDPEWKPAVSRYLTRIAVSSDGVFVGSRIDTNVFKLSRTGAGAPDPNWQVSLSRGDVYDLAIDGSMLYIAGSFSHCAGQPRNGLARVSTGGSGALDSSWNPAPSPGARVLSVLVTSLGVYLGGDFQQVGGQARTNLARIVKVGTGVLYPLWTPRVDSYVTGLALEGTNLFVLEELPAQPGRFIKKVDPTGSGLVDPNWRPNLHDNRDPATSSYQGMVSVIAVGGGALFAGGEFQYVNGDVSLGLAKLDAMTGLKQTDYPVQVLVHGGQVRAIARQSDGRILVGGEFWFANGVLRSHLLRLNTDGSLDLEWNPRPNNVVNVIAVGGNEIFIGGTFTNVGGQPRSRLAKLSAAGSDAPDPLWTPDANGTVLALAVNGQDLYVGGEFTNVKGVTRKGLARLNTTSYGGVDALWNPGGSLADFPEFWDDGVKAVALNGATLFVGGRFRFVHTNGTTSVRDLAKVSTVGRGEIDFGWIPKSSNHVYLALAVTNGALYAAGPMNEEGTVDALAKLDTTTGAIDPRWIRDFRGERIRSLVLDGTNLYAGGLFWQISGAARYGVAKLNTWNGGTDPGWTWAVDQLEDYNQDVHVLFLSGNNLYAGGSFTGVGGVERAGFALLPTLDAPSLIVDQGRLIITRNAADGPEVTHFRITGMTSVSLFQDDGVTAIRVGDFLTVAMGLAGVRYVGAGTVMAVSALNDTPAGAGRAETTIQMNSSQPPSFCFGDASYSVSEGSGFIVVTVRKIGAGPANVSYTTVGGTATEAADYFRKSGTLNFATLETAKTISISIVPDGLAEGNEAFEIALTSTTGGAGLVYPRTATITIVDNDAAGTPGSLTQHKDPFPLPSLDARGFLQVILNVADGHWRLIGGDRWRDSAATIGGMMDGFYELEFRPLPGYRAAGRRKVRVESARTNVWPLEVYHTEEISGLGDLRVVIQPTQLANQADPSQRGGWRLRGNANAPWRDNGETIVDLPAGYHVVEFKPVGNWAAPPSRDVRVAANQPNEIEEEYLPLNTSAGLVPEVLTVTDATATAPYLYNGQIRTPLGMGSGVVVKERVVLTAAHVLFDHRVLTFAPYSEVRWLFRKHHGEHEPVPQTPRGWYTREGYAALRRASDQQEESTPELQHLDVAAMYFVTTDVSTNLPGDGGFGGYLSSDDSANEWLVLGDRRKMLVGYPLDGIAEGARGKMHATPPTNASFTWLYWKVFATPDLRSFGGNSGGPLYVQYDDGRYYPAGIYLGRSAQTLVRAIDSDVVDLINRAEESGQGSGNHGGGGVARWESGVTASPFIPGLFRVNFVPSATATRGAGWRVVAADDPTWITSTNLYYPLNPGAFNVQFKPLPGYVTPPGRRVEVVVEQATVIDALYEVLRLGAPRRRADGAFQMSLVGETGRHYTVQWSRSLSNWAELVTLTNRTGATNLIDRQATNDTRRFYRALEH